MPYMGSLIGVELLSEFIETIVLTGRVSRVDPVSALMIAGPESGKTSIAAEKECKSVAVFTDITGGGLLELCKYKQEVTHIVLNDLTVVTGHSKKTGAYLFSILNAMTEEGIKATAFPGHVETYQSGKRALIGCVTLDMVNDKRRWWNAMGFSSRAIPICYQQSEPLIIRIQNGIKHSFQNPDTKTIQKTISVKVPDALVRVNLPARYADEIHRLSKAKADQLMEIGHRRLKQFLSLAMAHSLKRGWKDATVNSEDVRFIESVQSFISFTTPKLI